MVSSESESARTVDPLAFFRHRADRSESTSSAFSSLPTMDTASDSSSFYDTMSSNFDSEPQNTKFFEYASTSSQVSYEDTRKAEQVNPAICDADSPITQCLDLIALQERNYNRNLRCGQSKYLGLLSSPKYKHILSRGDIARIFSNLESLGQLSDILLRDIRMLAEFNASGPNNIKTLFNLAKVLERHFNRILEPYQIYCEDHFVQISTLKHVRTFGGPKVEEFLLESEAYQQRSRYPLETFLTTPIHHLVTYPKLIAGLISAVQGWAPPEAVRALDKVHRLYEKWIVNLNSSLELLCQTHQESFKDLLATEKRHFQQQIAQLERKLNGLSQLRNHIINAVSQQKLQMQKLIKILMCWSRFVQESLNSADLTPQGRYGQILSVLVKSAEREQNLTAVLGPIDLGLSMGKAAWKLVLKQRKLARQYKLYVNTPSTQTEKLTSTSSLAVRDSQNSKSSLISLVRDSRGLEKKCVQGAKSYVEITNMLKDELGCLNLLLNDLAVAVLRVFLDNFAGDLHQTLNDLAVPAASNEKLSSGQICKFYYGLLQYHKQRTRAVRPDLAGSKPAIRMWGP